MVGQDRFLLLPTQPTKLCIIILLNTCSTIFVGFAQTFSSVVRQSWGVSKILRKESIYAILSGANYLKQLAVVICKSHRSYKNIFIFAATSLINTGVNSVPKLNVVISMYGRQLGLAIYESLFPHLHFILGEGWISFDATRLRLLPDC